MYPHSWIINMKEHTYGNIDRNEEVNQIESNMHLDVNNEKYTYGSTPIMRLTNEYREPDTKANIFLTVQKQVQNH